MQSYLYNGVLNDPLGKWNDWFNNYEVRPDGSMGSPTRLPVIIEVGTADCPTVNRGNYGCSHGYWKNSSDAAWADAGYSRSQLFATVFGVTNGRGVITINTTTLQNALELGGGSYNNLARQGVAALLNASRGFYPYTAAEITAAVKKMALESCLYKSVPTKEPFGSLMAAIAPRYSAWSVTARKSSGVLRFILFPK